MVFVLNKDGSPLMPTERHGKVRHLLKDGQAKVVFAKPFTIQLLYNSPGYVQPVTLGVDSGYNHVGVSAVTGNKEVLSADIDLLDGQKDRLEERAMYRGNRRNRLRYRAPRFDNRSRKEGSLAPSIQHKLDSHIRIIEKVKRILPVSHVIIEVASFDIQAIKNPDIEGVQYQEGEQAGFWNLREYILHRDKHECQNPDCKNKDSNPVLQVHHMGFWKNDSSNRPSNLGTLCTKCHTSKNHQKSGFLWGWEPKLPSFRPETFMSTIRWRLIDGTQSEHTYGYETKSARIRFGLSKSHANDAFIIAGGTTQSRADTGHVVQTRRNNRSLRKFYDAQYIDIRTGEPASGKILGSQRRRRNLTIPFENNRPYRGAKLKAGKYTLRENRSEYQAKSEVIWRGQVHKIKGSHNKGTRVVLESGKSVSVSEIRPYRYKKGLAF